MFYLQLYTEEFKLSVLNQYNFKFVKKKKTRKSSDPAGAP